MGLLAEDGSNKITISYKKKAELDKHFASTILLWSVFDRPRLSNVVNWWLENEMLMYRLLVARWSEWSSQLQVMHEVAFFSKPGKRFPFYILFIDIGGANKERPKPTEKKS